MSFELEDSEEDISANLDGGHGTLDGGGLYPTGGSTPQQDEYDFDLEESTSRADSPVPPSPPSPPPPPVTMPPMRPVATGMAGKNRFKPQPEVMRRQQNPAYEDEAAAESGEGEEEEEEEGGDTLYSTLDGGGGIYEPRGMMVQLGQQQHQQQHSFAAPPTSSFSPRGGVEEELGESGGGGEVEEEYSSDMVEAISTSPAPGFPIPSTLPPALLAPGTRVWGLYRSGEEWFEGMVVAGNGDGTWVVSYGNDDEEEAVPLQRMRWVVEGGGVGGVGGGGAPHLPTSSSPAGEVIRDTSSPYSYTQDAFDEDVDSPATSPRAQLPSLNVGDGGSTPGAAAAAAAAVSSPAYSTPGSYPPSPPLSSPLAKSTTGGAVGGTPGGFVGVTTLQQQQQQHSVPAPPFPIGVSGGSGGSYLPPLPPGYTYAAVPLPSLSSTSSSSSSAAHPPPPPPPSYPSVGGGFHGGLAGIALALAQASPLLNLGSSSLASVINAHFGGGVSPATLQEAMNPKGFGAGIGGNSASSTATATAAAPPPPPPLQTPPTSAFLQALSAGLKLSGEGSNSSSTAPTYAPLHPAVAKALASAQATLATHDTLYARQLEALREVATRAKGRVQHMKERAGWGGGGMRPPGGGGGSPTSSFPPLMVPAPPPAPSFKSTWRGPGEEGRVPGGLSFQEALAIVKREGVRRDAAAAVAAAAL